MISLIVAVADNNVIGKDGDQPVYIPADLKRFKELTTGHTVIMGRKTFEAIVGRLGKPLPNRANVVLSRTLESGAGYTVAHSLEEALADTDLTKEVFVIGGGRVYQEFFDRTTRIYLTRIHAAPAGDVFFPDIVKGEWQETTRQDLPADGDTPAYSFITLERLHG